MKSYQIVVVGAGAAGLVVAIGAAKAGKRVLLIENGHYGGDCTNFGCIPSKSLIASAHTAESVEQSRKLGIALSSSTFIAREALERTRKIVEEVRSHEDASALKKMGVETLTGEALFKDPHHLQVGEEVIFAKQIVLATGSSPLTPPIKGLKGTPYLTNETIFDLQQVPESLLVMGGGPIGCELAQAFRRLGSKVSIIHTHDHLLNREEFAAQTVIEKQFDAEGIIMFLGVRIREVRYENNVFYLDLENGERISGKTLLVSVGRKPTLAPLHLDAAGVKYSDRGVEIDRYGRTSQKHIWAVGDVTGPPFFTHRAENQARSVLASLLLPFKQRLDLKQRIPRVTYTDPEVASAGLAEAEAATRHTIATYVVPFTAVDRAVTTGRTEGFIKVVTKKWSSQILGCTIVGPRAGEMLCEVTLAMQRRIPLRKLATLIHPYPTYSQAIRKAADLWLTQTILPFFKRR